MDLTAGAAAAMGASVGLIVGGLLLPRLMRKSGEYEAIARELETIRTKVETTERATAEIKAEINQNNWNQRERIALYRTRLEELLRLTYSIYDECSRQQSVALGKDELVANDAAENQLLAITALYFRDLRSLIVALRAARARLWADAYMLNVEWRTYRTIATVDNLAPEQREKLRAANTEKSKKLMTAMKASYFDVVQCVKAIEGAATPLLEHYVR
jgi:hypothetical protein